MANKFFPRMPNLVEVLNQMWDAFVVGPYNALSLAGGNLTGPVTSTSDITTAATAKAVDLWGTRYLTAGPGTPMTHHRLYRDAAEGGAIMFASRMGLNDICFGLRASSGLGGYGSALSVIYAGKNSVTNRTGTFAGTLNANGADYAEYMIKGILCGTIIPGQIVGIDTEGRLTDKWDLAISFAVKSTNPCMVGGDTWAAHLGPRPEEPARFEGETDDQWDERLTDGRAATAAFDAALEQARQTVDRIAFAGQVPVNLQGATPGQFIVPVQDGEGIAGLAVDEADITLRQYVRAIGRVIAIEDDGRARIIVKVA